MCIRDSLYANVALMGGTGTERVSAGADDVYFVVSGMNPSFHDNSLSLLVTGLV